jgi:hypothetical protein
LNGPHPRGDPESTEARQWRVGLASASAHLNRQGPNGAASSCRVNTTTFLPCRSCPLGEAAATAGGSRARSVQARADASQGDSGLLCVLGLPLGEGSCDLVDLMDDGLMATLGMRPPSPALLDARAGGRRPAKQRPGRPRGEGFPHASARCAHAQSLPRCTSQWIPESQLSPSWSSTANACRRRLLQKNKWAPLLGLKAGPTAG